MSTRVQKIEGNGKRNMSARARIDKLLKGKSRDEQIRALTMLIELYQSSNSYEHMDRYMEAVNRRAELKNNNGVSKKVSKNNPMEEGIMKDEGIGLMAGMALSGVGGC